MKILVVEDDAVSSKVMSAMLGQIGTVVAVATGKDALGRYADALAEGAPFHLVCLDLGLPDGSGMDVLQALRALESSFGMLPGQGGKILMVTAESDRSVAMKAFRQEADGYLVKPVKRAEILERLTGLGLLAATG